MTYDLFMGIPPKRESPERGDGRGPPPLCSGISWGSEFGLKKIPVLTMQKVPGAVYFGREQSYRVVRQLKRVVVNHPQPTPRCCILPQVIGVR